MTIYIGMLFKCMHFWCVLAICLGLCWHNLKKNYENSILLLFFPRLISLIIKNIVKEKENKYNTNINKILKNDALNSVFFLFHLEFGVGMGTIVATFWISDLLAIEHTLDFWQGFAFRLRYYQNCKEDTGDTKRGEQPKCLAVAK